MTVLGRRAAAEAARAASERLDRAVEELRAALRVLRVCPYCGAVFVRNNKQRYCTPVCSQATRDARRNGRSAPPMSPRRGG